MQNKEIRLIHPHHISKVVWDVEMEQKLSNLIQESHLSVRAIATIADVNHGTLNRLKGSHARKATEVDYSVIIRVLLAIKKTEKDLFSCWECGFSD